MFVLVSLKSHKFFIPKSDVCRIVVSKKRKIMIQICHTRLEG